MNKQKTRVPSQLVNDLLFAISCFTFIVFLSKMSFSLGRPVEANQSHATLRREVGYSWDGSTNPCKELAHRILQNVGYPVHCFCYILGFLRVAGETVVAVVRSH